MRLKWATGATRASHTTAAMRGSTLGSGSPSEWRGWRRSVPRRLGGFFFLLLLLLLEGAGCLANPGVYPHNKPAVNIYMSVEEVKKLLGKARVSTPPGFFFFWFCFFYIHQALGSC